MLKAFWDFLTNNTEPIDTLIKILTFLGIPIGALVSGIAYIARRWWRNRLRVEINAFDFIFDSATILARIYNEENNASPTAHHRIEYEPRDYNRDVQSELHEILKSHSRYLLIEGRTGLGKTREAVTLTKALMNEGYRVIRINTSWLDVPKEFPKELNNDRRRILFLLDDLNGLFRSGDFIQSPKSDQLPIFGHDSYHDRLLRTLDAFEEICGKDEILVIATARNEANEWSVLRFDDRDALWSRYYRYELPDPIDDSLVKLIEGFAAKTNLQIESNDLDKVVSENDGTYMNVVLNLQRLTKESQKLSLANYTTTLDGSWREVYKRSIEAQPVACYIYDSIDLLTQIGVDLHVWMVELMSRLLWKGNLFQRFFRGYKIRRAIQYLVYEEKIIANNNGELAPRDGQIEAKGTSVNWKPLASEIIDLVTKQSEKRPEELINSLFGFAKALLKDGFIEQAISLMKKRTELSPHNPQLWIELDTLFEALKRYEEAELALQKAIACNVDIAHSYFHLGLLFSETKRYQEAEEAYRKAVSNRPSYAGYINLGSVLQKLNRKDDAEEMYHKAIAIDPNDAAAYTNLGTLLREKNDRYQEAESYLTKAIELNDQDADSWTTRGTIFFLMKRFEDALNDLNRAVTLDNNKVSALANRAQVYFQQNRLNDALDDINRAAMLEKGAGILAIRGKILRRLRNYDESIEEFNKAISIGMQEDEDAILAERGEAYFQLGDYEKALSDFDLAVKLDSNFHWAYERRGVVLHRLNRLEEAIGSLKLAEETDPTCSTCIMERGEIYRSMGNFGQALEDFNHALELDNLNHPAFFERGSLYFTMGNIELALRDFDEAINIYDQYHLAYHQKCILLRFLNRFEESVDSIMQIINIDSACDSCLAELGETYRRMGKYQLALENLGRVIELGKGNDNYARCRRAAIYNALDDVIARDADISVVMNTPLENVADFYNKAVASTIINRHSDAIDLLEKAINIDVLARIYAQNDDLLQPLDRYQKFQELIK